VENAKLVDDARYNNPVYKTWRSLMAKEEVQGFVGLSAAERVFWCVYLLDLELPNGYYDQYFTNSSGDHANEVVSALRIIGADRAAQLTQEAIFCSFPNGVVPADRDERLDQMIALDEHPPERSRTLDQLSRTYCTEAEDVYPLLADYAERNGFLVR